MGRTSRAIHGEPELESWFWERKASRTAALALLPRMANIVLLQTATIEDQHRYETVLAISFA